MFYNVEEIVKFSLELMVTLDREPLRAMMRRTGRLIQNQS